MAQPLRIALAGLGTVGTGCVQILQGNGDAIAARAGRELVLTAVSARSRTRDRGVDLSGYDWHDDPVAMAQRADIDLVIEVIGGEDGPARAVVEAALSTNKHVVTANKALLARHATDLAGLAETAGRALRFEAAVAGGIPIVKALTEGMAANRVDRVMGVMNGTCNYILTQMEATGADYADVLAEAQALGYAEADPAFDVGGIDAAQKLALLSAIAFGTKVDFPAIEVEGIERVTLTDLRHAREMGYRIKLLGIAHRTAAGIEQRMQPVLVPELSPFSQLDGVTNMVALEGDFVGLTVYQGPGAGSGPTASAVISDAIDIARGLVIPALGRPASTLVAPVPDREGTPAPYYLRLSLKDRPGTLARVADVLGQQQVSIDRMRQIQHEGDAAPVLIVTHDCARGSLDTALGKIAAMDVSADTPVAYRIEEI